MRKFIGRVNKSVWRKLKLSLSFICILSLLGGCYIRSCDSSKNYHYYVPERQVQSIEEIVDEAEWLNFLPSRNKNGSFIMRVGHSGDFIYDEPLNKDELFEKYMKDIYAELLKGKVTPYQYPEEAKDYNDYTKYIEEELSYSSSDLYNLHLMNFPEPGPYYLNPIPSEVEIEHDTNKPIFGIQLFIFNLNSGFLMVTYKGGGPGGKDRTYAYVIEEPEILANIIRLSMDLWLTN